MDIQRTICSHKQPGRLVLAVGGCQVGNLKPRRVPSHIYILKRLKTLCLYCAQIFFSSCRKARCQLLFFYVPSVSGLWLTAWFYFASWTLWKQTVLTLRRANHSHHSEKLHNYSKECNTSSAWLVFKVILITLHGCSGTVPHFSCQGFWPGAEASAMVPEESFLDSKCVGLPGTFRLYAEC